MFYWSSMLFTAGTYQLLMATLSKVGTLMSHCFHPNSSAIVTGGPTVRRVIGMEDESYLLLLILSVIQQ